MEQSKVDMFIASQGKNFPNDKLMLVKELLSKMDDSKLIVLQSINFKSPTTVTICAFFFGTIGVDRFMLGQVGLGILKLITAGCFGLWTLIDLFTASGRTKKYNFDKLTQAAL